jgi:ATPase subunit of ABC transporter with duplicated ATPase domains
MDLATLALLEEYLSDQIPCAFMLVSHDRALLDAVTNRTLILRDARLYHFDLPYSAARRDLTEMDIAAVSTRAEEEKKIASLRASAKRLAVWGKVYDNEKLARKAKNMEKRVARMEQARTFVSRGSGLALSLESRGTRANRVLRILDLVVSPQGASHVRLFHIDELIIRPGDRIALLGPNGSGKTALLEILMRSYRGPGRDENGVSFSPQTDVGYYDQELQEVASSQGSSETMVQFLRTNTDAAESTIRNSLINAGFAYLDHDRRTNVLSGGERARLMFLRLRLNRNNFLIMDEPTNHIDIDGKEELEEQLSTADATLLMTSHDRRFIDNLANRFMLIEAGKLLEIQDPEGFYSVAPTEVDHVSVEDQGLAGQAPSSEDELLERMVELEHKLDEDLARKPKFQKPKMQAAWREELALLDHQLNEKPRC